MIIMKVGYQKYNHAKTPVAAVDPDVVSLLEQIIVSPDNF